MFGLTSNLGDPGQELERIVLDLAAAEFKIRNPDPQKFFFFLMTTPDPRCRKCYEIPVTAVAIHFARWVCDKN